MKCASAIGSMSAQGAVSRWALMALTFLPLPALAQGGDKQLQAKADALFAAGSYAQALPMYSQLVSLEPGDHDLNFRLGTCSLYGGDDKEKAIGYLKFAVQGPATDNLAWYFLGRAYHLDYQFDAAVTAYEHFRGTADKKLLDKYPVDALVQQCRNGKNLLGNIKDIKVYNKVEVAASDFFRFYDLSDIGGKIVTTPDELMTALDKKSKERSLVYLPNGGGTIYFSSYGKDGKTGRDIYRTDVLPTGGFSDPVKLAGYVNTDQDEDYGVMSSDGTTFYFCSKGHNSMGGYDVFKSSYDKASGIFGPPENMDFAVNTPADEMLYIVGPDGKQACFASTRESQQDMQTVYRVGTTPAPVNLSVIKGTYASAFDIMDRKAHIVVEDALTREKVADVKTDINGGYLLTLPHGGRYSFLVEGGPGGKTHLGEVDVPSNEEPAAYAQEIKLVNEGGEKLSITNHFDQALHEDVMAMALEEIKRRAKLDVTEEQAVAVDSASDKPVEDPMNAAGFAGNMSLEDAQKLAKGQQDELTKRAADEGRDANAAFALAASNVEAAESSSQLAESLVHQADTVADSPARTALMTQAAVARQRAREANDRASAALSTGHDLKAAQQVTEGLAAKAAATSVSLAQAVNAKDQAGTTEVLKQLKSQVDQQSGPNAAMTESERARKVASDAEKVAAGKLAEANGQRQDEAELADRITSLKRQRDAAKGNKKDDLTKQISTLEEQHAAMVEETDAGFAKARKAQEDAAMARGQVALLGHLRSDSTATATPAPTPDLAGVAQRMSNVKASIAALAIDQRYDAAATEPVAEKEQRTFDWGSSTDQLAQTGSIHSTDARIAMVPNTVSTQAASTPSSTTKAGNDSSVKQTATTGTVAAQKGNSSVTGTGQAASGATGDVAMVNNTGARQPGSADGTSTAQRGESTQDNRSSSTQGTVPSAQQQSGGPNASSVVADPADGDLQGNGDARDATAPGSVGQEGNGTDIATVNDAEEQMFFASNKLAELQQLRQGASKKAERDSLDIAIQAQEQQVAALHQARTELAAQEEAEPGTGPDSGDAADPQRTANAGAPQYTLLDNDPTDLSEQSADDIIAGFSLRRKQIMEGAGTDKGKAIATHQLEAELVDSIDAHLVRQTGLLAEHPEAADAIQPKIRHLQELRTEHVKASDEALAMAKRPATPAAAAPSASAKPALPPVATGMGSASLDDRVVITPDPASIYESVVQYRSSKAQDAAAINSVEVKQAKAAQAKVDSLGGLLSAVPESDTNEDLQKQTDKAKDDLLILRSEVGEHTDFIMKEEFATALDSSAALDRAVKKLGRPVSGPLAQMAAGFVQAAQADKDHGAQLRKDAARVEDIVVRDSLYRMAYADELHALQKLDQAITVRHYMLERSPAAGENITYAEVEQRMALGAMTDATAMRAVNMKEAETPVASGVGGSTHSTAVIPAVKAVAKDNAAANAKAGQAVAPSSGPSTAAAQESGSATGTTPATNMDRPSASTSEGSPLVDAASVVNAASPASGPLTSEKETPQASKDGGIAQDPPSRSDAVDPRKAQPAMTAEGQGHYFLLRSEARDARQASDAALAAAEASTDQAWELKNQAAALDASGGHEAEAARMGTRSLALFAQADSLRAVGQGEAGRATNFDAQADAYLASIPPEQAAALKAMEGTKPGPAPVAKASPTPKPTEEVAVVPSVPEKALPTTQQPPVDVPSTVVAAEPAKPAPVPAPVAPTKTVPAPKPEPAPTPIPAPAPIQPSTAFAVGPDIAPRQGAIPMDVAMPKGLVYMVQVGVFRNELPAKAFQDMTPVTGLHVGNGLMRYSAGRFEDKQEALKAQDQIRERGYKDAFVVAYMDGQRVSLDQAEASNASVAVVASTSSPVETPGSTHVTTPTTTTAPATDGEATTLAKYPTSAQAVLEDFHPMPATDNYYNDPTAAPAKQVETVKGLFFTVQVGVYSKPTPLDHLFNITPLNSERTANNKIRYTTGMYRDIASASTRKNATVTLGATDAFVTAYLNGKRIPLGDARALLTKLGPSILVDPQLTTP